MTICQRRHRDERLAILVTDALDSVHTDPVDLDAAFADLQSRMSVSLPWFPEEPEPPVNRAGRPHALRLRWRVAGALATVIPILLGLFLLVGQDRTLMAGEQRSEPRPAMGSNADGSLVVSTSSTSVGWSQHRKIPLADLRPAARQGGSQRTTSQPRVRSAVLDGHRVVTWVATMNGEQDSRTTRTFVYPLNGKPAQFSAVLPASSSGLTDMCRWTVQFKGRKPKIFHTRSAANVPIRLSAPGSAAVTIKVAAARPVSGRARCAMTDPAVQVTPTGGAIAAEASEAAPTGRPSEAATERAPGSSEVPSSSPSATNPTTAAPTADATDSSALNNPSPGSSPTGG